MLQWVEPSELSASSAAFPNAKISHARINLAHVPAVNAINITPVFYRTRNQAFTARWPDGHYLRLTGGIDALIRDGKIQALVSLGVKRTTELPDVPTMAESGLPDLRVITWNGFAAPAGTPDAIVKKLNVAVNEALMSPTIRETLTTFGAEPLGGSPQEFADFVSSESKKWSEIIRLSGVRID